jgi:hypothetical protein
MAMNYLQYSFGSFHIESIAKMEAEAFVERSSHTGLSKELLLDIWNKCKVIRGGDITPPPTFAKRKAKK